MAAAIKPATRSAIAIRDVHVWGQRLTALGRGISISPATGSSGIVGGAALSMRRSCRAAPCAAVAHLRQESEQMVQLIHRFFGRAQGQDRNSILARPGENAA